MEQSRVLKHLSDSDLIAEVNRLAKSERTAIANLVAGLGEMDARRLYLGQGCSSMFTYCTQVLHLAEHAAFNRIEAARAARRFPTILTLLAEGQVHLSAVRLLAPHLTAANHHGLLEEASHKSKREVEQIVARLVPRPDVRTSVRKVLSIPVPTTPVPLVMNESTPIELTAKPAVVSAPAPIQPPRAEPLAPGRYKLQFTVGEETYQKLRRAQDLLRHCAKSGDPAEVFDRALTLLLANLEMFRFACSGECGHLFVPWISAALTESEPGDRQRMDRPLATPSRFRFDVPLASDTQSKLFQIAIRVGGRVNQNDVERIAQATLRELGVAGAVVTVTPETRPGEWRVDIQGGTGPGRLRIRCGQGSTAQWVRQQIFDQYAAQS